MELERNKLIGEFEIEKEESSGNDDITDIVDDIW